MLKRPQRRLPARFNRRVKPSTLSFVKRRHQRVNARKKERVRRAVRRAHNVVGGWLRVARRWSLLVLVVVFLFLSGFIVFSPIIQVREIRVQRTEGRVDVARIQQALSSYFGRHLLFLPPADIRATVRETVPDLDDVTIQKQYPSRLFLRITLKPLVARLQIEGPPAPTASGALALQGSGAVAAPPEPKKTDFLTENGIYVATAGAQSGAVLPTIKITDWPVRPVPNTLLIEPEFLARMNAAERALTQEFGQTVRARRILIRAQEFHIQTQKLALWFDTRSPLEEQLQRYRTFLRSQGSKEATQYVDLRLSGRVVYR